MADESVRVDQLPRQVVVRRTDQLDTAELVAEARRCPREDAGGEDDLDQAALPATSISKRSAARASASPSKR
jgi:hypothetical protein